MCHSCNSPFATGFWYTPIQGDPFQLIYRQKPSLPNQTPKQTHGTNNALENCGTRQPLKTKIRLSESHLILGYALLLLTCTTRRATLPHLVIDRKWITFNEKGQSHMLIYQGVIMRNLILRPTSRRRHRHHRSGDQAPAIVPAAVLVVPPAAAATVRRLDHLEGRVIRIHAVPR